MANVLVTGGAGYIGSHACKALARAGHTPIAYDNLCRGHRSSVQWGPLVVGDIHDPELLSQTMKAKQVTAVLHFAAFAYIKESVEQPQMYFNNNVMGTALLCEAMIEAGVRDLVFSSTCATYGESKNKKISESHPQNPINPYGLSKLMVEKMLEKYQALGLLNFCALRYFNAAGADPDLEIGESHDPEPHLIPNLIVRGLSAAPMILNGDDYPTPDGTCIRDFIHVTDLAQAHVLTLEKLLKQEEQQNFYNIGSGRGWSLLEVAQTIAQLLNVETKIEFAPRRLGDPAVLVGDPSQFLNDFSWHPEHTDIKKVLTNAIQWHQLRNEQAKQ